MHMRHDGWAELIEDEEHGGCLLPMMMLYHEHDEDPEMRPEPISPEQREKSHRAHGRWAHGGLSIFPARADETGVGSTFKSEHGRAASRLDGMTRAPAAPGRNTRSAAAGRRCTEVRR